MKVLSSRIRRGTMLAAGLALASGLALGSATPAAATGTVTVQQSNGDSQSYANASIKYLKGKELRVTTADGKGTLVIDKAACTFDGTFQRCLLSSASLEQGGGTKPLDLLKGTAIANLSNEKQQLPMSSTQVPPNGILITMQTRIGTYINVTGVIDSVVSLAPGGAK